MEINVVAVIAATVAMFAVGAFWYMVPFAKIWGQMHGFDKLSKEKQKKMQSKMGPYYAVQILVTVMSAVTLSSLHSQMPNVSLYRIVFAIWFGFVVPAQVGAVIFGGTEPKWIKAKIAIMSAETLLHLIVAAFVVSAIQ